MSYEFPASVEREVERYAEEANLSPEEAAVRLVQSGLERSRQEAAPEDGLGPLRDVPLFAFLDRLPDSAIDRIEEASRQARAERLVPRR